MNIPLHLLTDVVAYWVVFWTLINALMPPREIFKDASPKAQARYNTILMLIAYYGALNIRQLTVGLYPSVKNGNGNGTIAPASHQLDNVLTSAAASSQKTSEELAKAQEVVKENPVPPTS